MLLQTGLVREIRDWASTKAVELRHSQHVPDVVFLDLNGTAQSDFAFAQQLAKLRPSVHIVACSAKKESNPDFLLQAMRSGVRDFCRNRYDRIEVSSMIVRGQQRTFERNASPGSNRQAVCGVGNQGRRRNQHGLRKIWLCSWRGFPVKSTVLLDFSRPLGDVSGLLDLHPAFQLRDAMENFKRLDPTLLSGLLTPHQSGLKVLAGAAQLEDWQHGSQPAIERLVEIAQQSFDFVVMDFGSFYIPRNGKTFAGC